MIRPNSYDSEIVQLLAFVGVSCIAYGALSTIVNFFREQDHIKNDIEHLKLKLEHQENPLDE